MCLRQISRLIVEYFAEKLAHKYGPFPFLLKLLALIETDYISL